MLSNIHTILPEVEKKLTEIFVFFQCELTLLLFVSAFKFQTSFSFISFTVSLPGFQVVILHSCCHFSTFYDTIPSQRLCLPSSLATILLSRVNDSVRLSFDSFCLSFFDGSIGFVVLFESKGVLISYQTSCAHLYI